MNPKLILTAIILAALGATGGYLLRTEMQQNDVDAINQADVSTERMNFTLADLEGKPRDFAEWDGQARIVNFWATWCAPCRREIPLLKTLQEEQRENGLQVIGIAVDFVEDVAAYAEEAQFNYPILVGQEDAMAVAESSGVQFIGLPFTLIVTPDGELIAAHLGEIHAEQLDTIVAQLDSLKRGDISLADARATLKNL